MEKTSEDNASPKVYPFRGADENNEYRVFPDELEDNPHIFFHGTAAGNLESILKDGFKASGTLSSVSFASNSGVPLRYACEARTPACPDGCVIAVCFDDLSRPGIKHESFGLYLYNLDEQPHVHGYCIIPAGYVFR
jgi:hypothetical protein